jgi:hypothetical protein
MVQVSATRCSYITILWVSLMSITTITLCVASQQVFILLLTQFVKFWIHPHTCSAKCDVLSWSVSRSWRSSQISDIPFPTLLSASVEGQTCFFASMRQMYGFLSEDICPQRQKFTYNQCIWVNYICPFINHLALFDLVKWMNNMFCRLVQNFLSSICSRGQKCN